MLAPRDRVLLLEALRPPQGFRLGHAIATTYTLDLVALLTAPLAFTFFDWEDDDGRPSADPIALLEAVRRSARRLHVFCQGGAIHVPKHGQMLLAHLEPCVVEVAAPRGGVFHPKVWLLRYEPGPEAEGEPARFRLLVGTRNLTFDRSWDTLLRLEGELTERGRPIPENRPLASFVAALPNLALQGAPPEAGVAAARMSEEVLRVRWELPDKVKTLEFLPLGLGDVPWPFDVGRRRLAIAPFADAWFLTRFAGVRSDGIVVSKPDSLHEAASALDAYGERYVLSADADEEDAPEEHEHASAHDLAPPCGLHAKLFVLDDGHRTHVFTGSANATRPAFERNVEFLVRLEAMKSSYGIEALLGRDEKGRLFDLLEPWHGTEVEDDDQRALRERLERAAEAMRVDLAKADLRLELAERADAKDDAAGDSGEFVLELHGVLPWRDDIELRCWPAVLSPHTAVEPAAAGVLARFVVTLGAATAFLAFDVVARGGGLEHRLRFVRRLPIDGLPADRDERILRLLLKDRDTVTRLLFLLLSAEDVSAAEITSFTSGEEGADWRGGVAGFPLFEPLVRALARGPEALRPVERLLADLSRTAEGRALLPEGFEALWAAVAQARDELARAGRPAK
jgi:hypothetical protein